MRKILIIMMLSCVCIAIASADNRPTQTNIDELARGQPIVGVVTENATVPMPGVIEMNRKTRDVDVTGYTNYNNYQSKKNTIAGNKTSPSYPDRVGWRSRH